nr:hypothetical protein [uncultured Prevotella sp.]
MMIIQKKSYIFGRNAGECSFFRLYSMENPLSIGYLIIQFM